MPAGEYSFACTERPDAVVIKGAGKEVRVPIKTRLRGPTGTLDFEGTLAFDRKGEVRTLSEVWIPNEEGVQVGSVEGAHAHLIVHVVPRPDEKMSGQKVFQQTCQVCHGANGQGNEKADKFFGRPGNAILLGLEIRLRPPTVVRADYVARHVALLAELTV